MRSSVRLFLLLTASLALPLQAQEAAPPADTGEIRIARAAGAIEVDGRIDDAGWQGAIPVETFFETEPGDNVPPKVRTVAWLAYDERYFYAAFEFEDDPKTLRAPLGDHDNVPSSTDYAGLFLDTRNNRQTALMLLVNPSNIQYDAITDDTSGEDPSYDLFWDSATQITERGWTLEIRVPFSSLRYEGSAPTWGVLLYRNRPRDFRYQMFSSRVPRGTNCVVCHGRPIVGLEGLPAGNHLVLAPYGTAKRNDDALTLGGPVAEGEVEWDGGVDAKWTPNADTAFDATLNPDFSQIESDVAQITANERFALFFQEKRPFFLEGLDLFATPLQAVYTRTITSPSWGLRSTGKLGGNSYTLLVTEDRGGGSAILPGADFSGLAPQDFGSTVLIGRVRRDLGQSFVSFLVTDREIEGGGHNRVLGPDFQWRPTPGDSVRGQLLFSDSETPDRPELAAEWDGRGLSSHAFRLLWNHATPKYGWLVDIKDIGDEFRADTGFLPQVGIRDVIAEVDRRFYPKKGAFRRLRPFVRSRLTYDRDDEPVLRRVYPGIEFAGLLSSFGFVNLLFDQVRTRPAGPLYDLQYLGWTILFTPSRRVTDIFFDGLYGDDLDLFHSRKARGGTLRLRGKVRPTDHLELDVNVSRRWLDLAEGPSEGERLLTAEVARLRATYTFTSRAFLRLIGQEVRDRRDPALWAVPVRRKDEAFSSSALFAYKLNWQTVLFVGYGDERAFLETTDQLEPLGRQLFLKVSYAFQR